MTATLVFSDRLDSITIDRLTTSSTEILYTLSQVDQRCSAPMKNKFHEHMKQPGACNQRQCNCIAAMLFQKHYVADNNWSALNDEAELWDAAVSDILDAYREPFAITIQKALRWIAFGGYVLLFWPVQLHVLVSKFQALLFYGRNVCQIVRAWGLKSFTVDFFLLNDTHPSYWRQRASCSYPCIFVSLLY